MVPNPAFPKSSVWGVRVEAWLKTGASEAQMAAVDTKSGSRLAGYWNLGRRAGYCMGVTAETVKSLCEQGQLNEAVEALGLLVQAGCSISKYLFYAVLKNCAVTKDLVIGRRLHAFTVKKGYELDTLLCNHIVRMYAAHGRLQEAADVFSVVPQPDAFMWSSIISAYVKHGQEKEAVRLYHTMRRSSAKPDGHVFVAALQACARGVDLESGQQVHADVLSSGVEPDLFVSSSLVDMYAKCGSLEDAQRVFDGIRQKDVVAWSAMIAGYSQQGMGQEALRLYRALQDEGKVALDSVTFLSLLQACASVGNPALEEGRQLHAQIRKRGFEADVFVANSLVNMYARCGSLEDAQGVFEGLPRKDVGTWNAMIAGHSQNGMGQEALGLYRSMQEEGIVAPNSLTFVCILQACASVAALDVGRQLHAQIKEQGLQADVLVASSLINTYGKCGSMVDARQVFDALPQRDVLTWSALIAGYSREGDSAEVFDLVDRMREDGIQPDGVTFLSVLTVCSHTGLVNKGREYFEAMTTCYGITPTADHYTCMVDLLGRAGKLDAALAIAKTMPVPPTAAVWRTLLGACRKWSNVVFGCLSFQETVKLDSKDAAAYVLMFNIYTSAHMWEQAQEVQERRMRVSARKQPGQSWWTDMDGLVHRFLVGGKRICLE